MNGMLPLPAFRNHKYYVLGGPYYDAPHNTIGVKLASEISAPCEINLPIRDFSVPDTKLLLAALDHAIDCMMEGDLLYVGCMGGRGRTGLFLSCLAKAWGINNPIQYVRANYYSHAVETDQQAAFVNSFRVPYSMRMKVILAKARAWVTTPTRVPENIWAELTRIKSTRRFSIN